MIFESSFGVTFPMMVYSHIRSPTDETSSKVLVTVPVPISESPWRKITGSLVFHVPFLVRTLSQSSGVIVSIETPENDIDTSALMVNGSGVSPPQADRAKAKKTQKAGTARRVRFTG